MKATMSDGFLAYTSERNQESGFFPGFALDVGEWLSPDN
jgi:hypothetical protein